MKRCGWVERSRETRPAEARVLVTLSHPCHTIGEGYDRYRGPVENVRQPSPRRPRADANGAVH